MKFLTVNWADLFIPTLSLAEILIRGTVTYLALFIMLRVILGWSYTLDWLGSHFDFFSRLLRPPPLLLVEDGEMLRHNMRRELITPEELMSELRQSGVEDIREVKRMYMEGDGQFSVIRKDDQGVKRKDRTPSV